MYVAPALLFALRAPTTIVLSALTDTLMPKPLSATGPVRVTLLLSLQEEEEEEEEEDVQP